MYAGWVKYVLKAFVDATASLYGYMRSDYGQETGDLKTTILPSNEFPYVYLIDSTEQEKEMKVMSVNEMLSTVNMAVNVLLPPKLAMHIFNPCLLSKASLKNVKTILQ